ncbi:MAG TPA: carboxymuconolactone decarboxylase family protein [Gammaproteobacteria bacterium]|nr:carboxymuconolactone decarboxylase family protein [Gammaproteobacteria bacterium]
MSKAFVLGLAAWSILLGTPAHAQPTASPPRFAPVPESQRTPEQQAIVTEFSSLKMPNYVATLLNYPQLARLLGHVVYVTTQSGLPPRHRALLALRTAGLTRSAYLWGHVAPLARANGLTDDDLARIARGPDAPGWDAFEQTALRAADELHVDSFLSDATWKALSTRYNVNQLVDVIDTAGTLTMHAGVINSVRVEVERDVKDRLPPTPFTAAAKRTNIRLEGKGARIPPREQTDGRAATANLFRTFNLNPAADRTRGMMNQQVNNTNSLPPRRRELLLMRIGILCRSEYEYAAHHRVGVRAGLTDADVAHIIAGPGSGGGEPLDDVLLRAADELFENDVISNGTWDALAQGGLDTKQLFDVLITVDGYRWNSMLISSAGVQLDENMADFRFPPSLR